MPWHKDAWAAGCLVSCRKLFNDFAFKHDKNAMTHSLASITSCVTSTHAASFGRFPISASRTESLLRDPSQTWAHRQQQEGV